MLRCEKCKVSLIGNPTSCPLCQGDTSGVQSLTDNVFPHIPMDTSRDSIFKTVSVSVIILSIAVFFINATFPEAPDWLIVVIPAMISLWISFYFILKNKKKLPKSIAFQAIIISLLADSWDSYYGYYRWSIAIVIPIVIVCAIILIFTLAMVKKMYVGDYAIYLFILCIYGIVCFNNFRKAPRIGTAMMLPLTICFYVSCTAFVLLLMFKYKDIWAEIKRRLHF